MTDDLPTITLGPFAHVGERWEHYRSHPGAFDPEHLLGRSASEYFISAVNVMLDDDLETLWQRQQIAYAESEIADE